MLRRISCPYSKFVLTQQTDGRRYEYRSTLIGDQDLDIKGKASGGRKVRVKSTGGGGRREKENPANGFIAPGEGA